MVCPFQLEKSGLDSRSLTFSCDLCPYNGTTKGNIAIDAQCLQQFLQIVPFFKESFPCRFSTKDQIFSTPATSMRLLREYSSLLQQYEPALQLILHRFPDIKQQLYSNPLSALQTLKTAFELTKKRIVQKFIIALEKTELVSQLQIGGSSIPTENSYPLTNLLKVRQTPRGGGVYSTHDPYQILGSYELGPFRIEILDHPDTPFENHYRAVLALNEALSPRVLQHLHSKHISSGSIDLGLQTLDEVIHSKMADFQHYLATNFAELHDEDQRNLAIYATAQSLNLTKTFPLLFDDEVQEVYLDRPGNNYYLDHSRWGRCRTNLTPSPSELSHLVTRLRLESRRPLDEKTPSLKTELKTSLFHVRAAIDIPPLAHNGPHLNIRKIRMRVLTLPELVSNKTISLAAAAFLILCMSLRINITICGEPATGKTTLANSINMVAPPSWRRIAIEDVLESVSVNEEGRHKVIFKVDPFDSPQSSQSTKSNEIIRLLHRSPDWVFLGELQTAEHSSAMFHALSAGIKGIQTCHANSNAALLLRWRIHHNIPEVCFRDLGLLIHLVKENNRSQIIRRVAQISEISFKDREASLRTLFEWNQSSGQLEQKEQSIVTPLVSQSCKFQEISKTSILRRYRVYKETLSRLIASEQLDPLNIVSTFDAAHASQFPGNIPSPPPKSPSQKKNQATRSEPVGIHTVIS
jgi:type IV secretory pathway ATPase VirB11/archaellum biosynthesis ATPase